MCVEGSDHQKERAKEPKESQSTIDVRSAERHMPVKDAAWWINPIPIPYVPDLLGVATVGGFGGVGCR